MRIAIMQPYIFPYIGYFQLINAVDKFVIFDDVNYINKGWINRNNILLNNESFMFSFPINKSSQNKLINELELSGEGKWKEKFLKTLHSSYSKAPNYKEVYKLVDGIVYSGIDKLSDFLRNSILETIKYLGIDTEVVNSSSVYGNSNLKGEGRIIDICKKENATGYINPIGGVSLYDKKKFSDEGIDLFFLQAGEILYSQPGERFIPNLSIIDVMMYNDVNVCRRYLDNYSLI